MAKYSVCGIDCDECSFYAQSKCRGCRENKGVIFWGKCDVFSCCDKNKLDHCGRCEDFPCDMLREFASSENPERIDNLNKLRRQEEM